MRGLKTCLILGAILLFCLIDVWLGRGTCSPWPVVAGGVGICYVALRVALLGGSRVRKPARTPRVASRPPAAVPREPVDPNDTDALVEQMLDQGRFALLLRPQIARNLNRKQFGRAVAALEKSMALVPDGDVVLDPVDEEYEDDRPGAGRPENPEIASTQGRVIQVERFFLDRYPVTNRVYYEFVAAGGYEEMALWDESIWPAVLDLVDATGMPGPKHWQNGCFLPGQEDHPVVGINWYEANAAAQWLGKRLCSDAEWVKAGSWPVSLSSTTRMQRRYPWGGTMDRSRANLWGSGSGETAAVDQFAKGVSVGGVYQLIGNVWEWTGGSYRASDLDLRDGSAEVSAPTVPMKSIRGGAFDTYFDNQATCQFQSGENPLHRRHNIGYRCAVGICDVMLTQAEPAVAEPAVNPRSGDPRSGDPRSGDPRSGDPRSGDQQLPEVEEVLA